MTAFTFTVIKRDHRMHDQSLYFELFSIVLLLCLGVFLLTVGLPGWGLIIVSALLAALSSGLRKLPTVSLSTTRTTVSD